MSLEKVRAYLTTNYPTSVEGENHRLDDEGNIVAWGFSEFGEPPTREQMLTGESALAKLEKRLLGLDAARQTKWLEARKLTALALSANGWSMEEVMAAGSEFVNAYAALSFGYWYGGANGSLDILSALQADEERKWLNLSAGRGTVRDLLIATLS